MEPKNFKTSAGEVVLKTFVTRKTAREYSAALFEGSEAGMTGSDVKIPLKNMDTSNDVLVLGCIETIDGRLPGQEDIDKMKTTEFNQILAACKIMMDGEERSKKK